MGSLSLRGINNASLEIRRVFSEKAIFNGTIVAIGVLLIAVFLPQSVPRILTVPVIVGILSLLPGGLLLLILQGQVVLNPRSLLYSVGVSLVLIMGHGAVSNIGLHALGVSRPMERMPIIAGLSLLLLLLAAVVRLRSDAELVVDTPEITTVPAALALIPLYAVVGVAVLNRTGSNVPLLLILVVISVLPLLMVAVIRKRWHVVAVWVASLGILYHKSLARIHNFSGNPEVVFTWQAGLWEPGFGASTAQSSELLPLGVLYPSLAKVSQIDILTQMEVVNPIFVSLIPVAIYITSKKYVGSRRAALAAMLFAFAHPFYKQYPPAGRASIPVVFLALLWLVLSDDEFSPRTKSVIAIMFGSGVVVSHYGTSYLLLFALWGGIGLLFLYRAFDRILHTVMSRRSAVTDGGTRFYTGRNHTFRDLHTSEFLSLPLVLYYSVLNLAWYLYLDAGEKFHLLPNHIVRTVRKMFVEQDVGGGQTAARLARNYGTSSIFLSKRLYILLALLMVLGLGAVYYRRFISTETPQFTDEHIAFATMFLAIFSLTVLVPSWGGGRPMMITFVFTVIFATVGATVLFSGLAAILTGQIKQILAVINGRRRTIDGQVLACILLVLFIINSGVFAALASGERAPSNVPTQESLDEQFGSTETDVSAHVWIIDHRGSTASVFGDGTAQGQSDWLNPQIGYQTEGAKTYGQAKPTGMQELLSGNAPSGYVILVGSNLDKRQLNFGTNGGIVPLSRVKDDLSERHLVYTSGYSQVYYANSTGE